MIIRSRPKLKDIIFAVNGSILPLIAGRLITIALVTLAAIVIALRHPGIFSQISAIPFTLIGIALSVFMSFRNSACYERWWEGRKLWGDLIIACRSLAREASTLRKEDQDYLLRGLCAFASGLAARLRNKDECEAIKPWFDIGQESSSPNITNTVVCHLGTRCLTLMHQELVGPIHYSVLEKQLTALSHVQAACERIASTPVPFAYSLLLHRTAFVFCLTLPFALAGSLYWWTFLPVLLTAYTFFGLDALGHQLEDPFGLEPNALPLDAMKRTIEREMLFMLGSSDIPPPLEPRNYVLN